jgi:hypothetical protein
LDQNATHKTNIKNKTLVIDVGKLTPLFVKHQTYKAAYYHQFNTKLHLKVILRKLSSAKNNWGKGINPSFLITVTLRCNLELQIDHSINQSFYVWLNVFGLYKYFRC